MKAEFEEFRKQTGEIRLFPESLDDLWHLKHLLREGDLIYAQTFRSLESQTDKVRPEKSEKKPVRLGIRVTKVEFHHNANRLRISGVIVHGVDEGFHHTVNLEAGQEISVIKHWHGIDLERIERAVRASTAGVVHVISLEEGYAEVYRMRQYGPELFTTISGGSGKREGTDARSMFFGDAMAAVQETTGPLVIAGPGFVKEDFLKFIRLRNEELADRCLTVETRRVGKGAVQEVIGQGVLERITEDIQLAREVSLLDQFLARMGGDGAIAYGIEEVRKAIAFGAVEDLLVIDHLIRDEAITSTLEEAEAVRARITVYSSEFEPGKQLEALGGIAALLRFAIE
ncbi:mRNA surveillance protein Pelota [Methanomicrobiaceae archaeon CYW5]|uniref:mRNA surveillance protein pelota n=1 Tax=Methanovulcanius yangii TaxID=1789227 RepID=UPI0029CA1E1A|nr:mRNA surveillance protein pelota [Methanovulcanius yangii]MBT8507292.1 mRNA surveillance protein Pelota [Methanovulcanius yangii]